MAYIGKFFFDPFATGGDRTAVPDAVQPGGQVSFTQGYGPDYSLDPLAFPEAILVERQKFNYLLYVITLSLGQLQTDFPQYVSAADNGGAAFAYNLNAVVRLPADGVLYQNTAAGNTQAPPGNGWVVFLSQYALTSALNAEIARAIAAEATKAPLVSPAFSGNPTAPTAAPGATGNILSTLDYVIGAVAAETNRAIGVEGTKAPLASPVFTGNPRGPTPAPLDASASLAPTQFVTIAVAVETSRAIAVENSKAPLNSPAFTGVPTTDTPDINSADRTIPNTAWVKALLPAAFSNLTVRYARIGVPIGGSFALGGYTWNAPFPTQCLAAVAAAKTNDVFNPNAPGNNFTAISYGETVNGGQVRVDTNQGLTPSGNVPVDIIGVGF